MNENEVDTDRIVSAMTTAAGLMIYAAAMKRDGRHQDSDWATDRGAVLVRFVGEALGLPHPEALQAVQVAAREIGPKILESRESLSSFCADIERSRNSS